METFSALLALCVGNLPVTGELPSQRQVMWSLDVFFDLQLNKGLSKHSWGWWFEMSSRLFWHHRIDKFICGCRVLHFSFQYCNTPCLWECDHPVHVNSHMLHLLVFNMNRYIKQKCGAELLWKRIINQWCIGAEFFDSNDHFTDGCFCRNSNPMSISDNCYLLTVYHIVENFGTYNCSTDAVPCAKLCCDHFVIIWKDQNKISKMCCINIGEMDPWPTFGLKINVFDVFFLWCCHVGLCYRVHHWTMS